MDLVKKGFVLWFTGLSGAGKSTLSHRVGEELARLGGNVEILDGDEVRSHLSRDLGFSEEDRNTNVRRIGFVARLLARNGVIAITAAISPYQKIRDEQREAAIKDNAGFCEVYMQCPLEVLAQRDVKGLYKKALSGELANFTGVTDPYEPPRDPEVVVHSDRETVEEGLTRVLNKLVDRGYLSERARIKQ